MANSRNHDGPFENVFMMRVLPYNTAVNTGHGLEYLVVKVTSQPGDEWQDLSTAVLAEVTGALDHADIELPSPGAQWELDFTDLLVLWCDPADWWTDMTRISERNCAAVLEMMRERGHQDALSMRLLFQGEGE